MFHFRIKALCLLAFYKKWKFSISTQNEITESGYIIKMLMNSRFN